jgi:hypothetical protein
VHCTLGSSSKKPGATHFWLSDIGTFVVRSGYLLNPQVQRTVSRKFNNPARLEQPVVVVSKIQVKRNFG